MSCCGNQRSTLALARTNPATATSRPSAAGRPAAEMWRVPAPPRAPAAPPMPVPAPVSRSPGDAAGLVRLRYLARPAILVHGARTGARYHFSESQPVQAVQRADAESLLATGHFRREA